MNALNVMMKMMMPKKMMTRKVRDRTRRQA
jgi:hypothetical protein